MNSISESWSCNPKCGLYWTLKIDWKPIMTLFLWSDNKFRFYNTNYSWKVGPHSTTKPTLLGWLFVIIGSLYICHFWFYRCERKQLQIFTIHISCLMRCTEVTTHGLNLRNNIQMIMVMDKVEQYQISIITTSTKTLNIPNPPWPI
jgi:hypothetical protein